MMSRYKPQGWRNDQYRHSLAARGIRTSFYVSPFYRDPRKDEERQQRMLRESKEQERIQRVKDWAKKVEEDLQNDEEFQKEKLIKELAKAKEYNDETVSPEEWEKWHSAEKEFPEELSKDILEKSEAEKARLAKFRPKTEKQLTEEVFDDDELLGYNRETVPPDLIAEIQKSDVLLTEKERKKKLADEFVEYLDKKKDKAPEEITEDDLKNIPKFREAERRYNQSLMAGYLPSNRLKRNAVLFNSRERPR